MHASNEGLRERPGGLRATCAASYIQGGGDEAIVVAAAQNGHAEAFEILFKRHGSRILHLAQRITRNREDAEDVTQESFQKAFSHMHSFQARSAFSTWLTRIAINEALLLLRKNRGVCKVSIEEEIMPEGAARLLEIPDASHVPERRYLDEERMSMLYSALNELSPLLRSAIELRELHERSTRETANILRISLPAVKARLFRGRRKLRQMLNGHCRVPGSCAKSCAMPCECGLWRRGVLAK